MKTLGFLQNIFFYFKQKQTLDIFFHNFKSKGCQVAVFSKTTEEMYHFEGCLEKFKKQIVNNKELVIWVSIAALLSLVIDRN